MRQPQRVHKKFYRLKLRANFFIGRKEYQKEGFCWYRQINKAVHTAEEWGKRTPVQFIAPWTVVRSDEYVNKKICAATPDEVALANARCRSGDGCVPPHVEPGPVSQPNSDNGISGPTS